MRKSAQTVVLTLTILLGSVFCYAWEPLPVTQDPLVRMPGTQQDDGVSLKSSDTCLNCHAGYDETVEPAFNWAGSMMGQAARDPIFWAVVAVSAQDSVWLTGRPNATDLCLRCHTPAGWLEGRSDPTNGASLVDSDFDGVECVACHRSVDPFFEDTYGGVRESDDWNAYWNETNLSSTPSIDASAVAYAEDWEVFSPLTRFDGASFFNTATRQPVSNDYTEAGGGQLFASLDDSRRGPFADATARHTMTYSRFHKSRYFCNTCHDVSNPALANIDHIDARPGDNLVLPSESLPAFAYGHVERTFSEFMLSAYAAEGGAPGEGPYDGSVFDTPLSGNNIGACQHCHMAAETGAGCDKSDAPIRPDESTEHPNAAQPVHDFTGGNAFVTEVLASAISGSPTFDSVNRDLLTQGPAVLTMDLNRGIPLNATALLDAADRAVSNLERAAAVDILDYDADTGVLVFRIQNQTGHRLPSGYPEGRRMFVNVKAFQGGTLMLEVNPYDPAVNTLKGLPLSFSPESPPVTAGEIHDDRLVFEAKTSSSFTGEEKTFHFVLADGLYKDNRIPPKGYRIEEAAARLSVPFLAGTSTPDLFSDEEYIGGYADFSVSLPAQADRVEVILFYQTTSREFIEFLRTEIDGTGSTLSEPPPSAEPSAYIIGTDPFFDSLRAWGETIWQLWEHNGDVPGAAPIYIAGDVMDEDPCADQVELCDGEDNNCDGQTDEVFTTLGDSCSAGTGACATTGTLICNVAQTGVFCDAIPSTGGDEVCDGIDNDCDGQTDEGVVNACGVCGATVYERCDGADNDCDGDTDEDFPDLGELCTVGTGACSAAGTVVCNGVGDATICSSQPLTPTEESCDGEDNDCDGQTDEDFAGLGEDCAAGDGVCRRTGIWTCSSDLISVVCTATPGDSGVELCDMVDNDCDGETDEDFPSKDSLCSVGSGICLASGVWVCSPTGEDVICDAVPGPPDTEICDGMDNDCDGTVDNGCACQDGEQAECYSGPIGTDGIGICHTGTIECSGGVWQECLNDQAPLPERCDGIDNNCDGNIDEPFADLGQHCVSGVGECAWAGNIICGEDGLGITCNATATEPTEERCDGVDNNCDGDTDELFPGLGEYCVVGTGECKVEGIWRCDEAGESLVCDATTRNASVEICDGLDNDCDGETDNGFTEGTPCDDTDPCTYDDQWAACACKGIPYTCEANAFCDGLGSCTGDTADTETDTETDNDTGTEIDTVPCTDTDGDTEQGTPTDTHRDSDIDTAMIDGGDTETGVWIDTDTGTGFDTVTAPDSDTDAPTDNNGDTGTDSHATSDSETLPGTDTEIDTANDTERETASEPFAGADTNSTGQDSEPSSYDTGGSALRMDAGDEVVSGDTAGCTCSAVGRPLSLAWLLKLIF